MQRAIAAILMQSVRNTPGFSKFGGLVQTLVTTERATDKGQPVRLPISLDAYPAPPLGSYAEFSPDSAESGILYFEPLGLTVKGQVGERLQFESRLRLVAWMQGSREAAAVAPALLLRRLLSVAHPRNAAPFSGLKTSASRIYQPEDGLFSRYTYREDIKQYLLDPYAAFGIELVTTFNVSPACISPL